MPAPRPPRPHVLFALLALAAALAATLALVACGGKGKGADDAGGADAGPAGSRTIADVTQTRVEVPNAPRRVVVVGAPVLDGALAVGLRPVAAAIADGPAGIPSYLAKQARGVAAVGAPGRPDLEHVAALDPDLIVVDGGATGDGAVVARLRGLAPTVDVARGDQDWRTTFAAVAEALNRQREAAHVLSELDGRIAEVRRALGDNAGARIGLARWEGRGLTTPAPAAGTRAAGQVLGDLGLRQAAPGDARAWLFLGAASEGAEAGDDEPAGLAAARRALRAARAAPAFARLAAVRRHRVVAVDDSAWTGAGGPIAARLVVDDVAGALAPSTG